MGSAWDAIDLSKKGIYSNMSAEELIARLRTHLPGELTEEVLRRWKSSFVTLKRIGKVKT